MRLLVTAAAVFVLSGCIPDDNDAPKYGEKSGLPLNCRAYVQAVVDNYRAKQQSADDSMNGLERNCGIHGHSWKNRR